MAQYLPLPDGSSVTIREGETPRDAWARAQRMYPEAFVVKEAAAPGAGPQPGFVPAFKSGVSGLKSGIAALAGKTGIMDPAAAQQYIEEQEKYQKETYAPTATFGEAPVTKTLELLGGSIPYMAAPIAAGTLAATAPVSAPLATALGIGAAGAVSSGQFTGSNLITQMKGEEGAVAPKTLEEANLGAAFAASIPQAALDAVSFKMLPGIRNLLTAAGKEVTPTVAKRIAEQGIKEVAKDYALTTGKTMGAEGLTEAGQQFFERLQAGLSLTDERARNEYIDSLVGGAVLGGVLAPAGRFVERRGQAGREEEARLAEAKAADLKEGAAREVAEAFRKTPEGQMQFVQEYESRLARFKELKNVPRPGKDATPLETADYKEAQRERAELGKQLTKDTAAYKTAKAAVAQIEERQRTEKLTPEDYMLEQMGLAAPAAKGEAAPAPEMRTVIDEFGQISEVPVTPPAATEAPAPAAQYLTGQIEAARGVGLMDLGDYADYAMQDPAMAAQVVQERPKVEGLTTAENNALLTGIKLRLKEAEKKLQAANKAELARRNAELQAQTTGVAPDAAQQAAAQMYAQQETELREGETNFDYLDGLFEKALSGTEVIKLDEAIKPDPRAEAARRRIESLFAGVAQADADYRTARASGENKAAEAAVQRKEAAQKALEAFAAEGSPYVREFMAARKLQEDALAKINDIAQQLRAGKTLGGPQAEAATGTPETLKNEAERMRAQLITAALQEAAMHRRAAGRKALPQDEALKAASAIDDTVNTLIERASVQMPREELSDAQKNLKPVRERVNKNGQTIRTYKLRDPETGSIAELTIIRQKDGTVFRVFSRYPDGGGVEFDNKYGKAMTDADIIQKSFLDTEMFTLGQEAAPRLSPAEIKHYQERMRTVLDRLMAVPEGAATRETPLLRTQFAETEAQKTAEARGETATTLGGELRKRTEFVRDKMAKMGAMRPMARDALNAAADVMDSGRATRDLLDTVEPVVDAITSGRQVTQTDLRAIKDALAAISKQAQEGATVGKIEKQRELFTDTAGRALSDATLGIVRSTPEKFANAPQVKKAQMAIERAKQLAEAAQKEAAKTATTKAAKVKRQLETKEMTVEAQRADLQKAMLAAITERREAFKAAAKAADPAVAAAQKELDAADKALETLYEQVNSAGDVGNALKFAADVAKQREELTAARTALDKALAESQATYDGKALIAAAQQDSMVQFEQKVLDKLEKELAKLQAKAMPQPAAVKAVEEQRARTAKAQSDMREAVEAAAKEKRALDQRLLSRLGLAGVKRVAGEKIEIASAQQNANDKEVAESRKNLAAAQEAIAGTRLPVEQTPRATGPVTRTTQKAPTQFLTGTAESRAGETRAAADQRLSEARTPARSEKAITAAEQQQANELAERLREEAAAANKQAQEIKGTKAAPEPKKSTKVQRGSGTLDEDIGLFDEDEGPVVYRTTTPGGKGVDYDALNTMVTEIVKDWENVPTIVTVENFDALPENIKAQALADNVQDVLPGLYDPPTNTVYLVATNLHNKEDVLATVAHEIAGHFGLRSILGRGYTSTMNALYNGNKAVREKADAKMAEMPRLSREVAVEEVLADMAETAPAEQTSETKSALRQIMDAIKAWFQRTFGDKVSDAAVQQIVANARKYVIEGGKAGEGGIDTSGAVYRVKPKYANAEMERLGRDTDKVVAKQKTFWQKVKANTTGLAFETQLVDRFTGFERLAKYMDSLKGSQMMFYLRMYDQRMNFVSQAVANGAPQIVEKTRKDGRKEFVIEAKAGPSIKGVVETLAKAQPMVGNAEAVNRTFTMYLAALRADRVGLNALNFGGDVTQAMLDNAKALVERTPGLKKVFDDARAEYNAYNRSLMNFLAETGALSEGVAKRLADTNDYIPFYREQNGNAMLIIGNENPIRVGSIAEQPYLQELVGGDTAILDFLTSSVQNTNMLVDMGLHNLATKNAVFELVNLNAAKIVKSADGPDVVKFKVDGEDRYAVIDTETVTVGGQRFNTGVPAELLVKGMEGIPTQMTGLMRVLAMPSQLLRKAVTLSPMYMAKQLFRDSLAAPIVSGADFTPVFGALKQIKGSAKPILEARGITGGQYLSGTTEDMAKILRDIGSGKPGWMSALSKVEAIGMEADALTRRAQYNSYIEQGLSEMEATLMALESMNFNKRGASPSIHMANAMVPFMNAQIQGLNVLYKAFTGKMPFNDQLKLRKKLLLKGGLLAGATLAYAVLMEDDDAYKNATPDQKYGNWFVRIPGVDEPVRIPVPFEIGYIFKALPEALYNSMTKQDGAEEAVKAFKQIALQTIPGGSSYGLPQALKPAIEAGLGKSFYTGRDILSAREKELLPEEQFRAGTSELAKALGKSLDISPVTFEFLVRGYTGTLGIAFLHALSLGAPKSESPEAAVKRLSEYPLVGGSFQPNDAGGIINTVYERFGEDMKVRASYKKMLTEGRAAEAAALLQRRGNEILEAEIGDKFKQNMSKMIQAERAIAASGLSAEEKRKQLDAIRKIKTGLAATYREVADKTTPR